MDNGAQLNKLQIKAEILTVISKLQSAGQNSDLNEILEVLDAQNDKNSILEILIKEFLKANEQKSMIICFLLLRLCDAKELEAKLWEMLKNPKISDMSKSFMLNLLKEMGQKIDYDSLTEYFENPEEVIDADTQKLLHTAIVNPEAQIDFMDFLKSLPENDKEVLINSLGEDYTSDALANILNPLFQYAPESKLGQISAEILGDTRSQLALHTLLEAKDFVEDEATLSIIKKSISKLKIAGVREDNAIDFYKNILSESSPYKSYTSYPDGHGNQAIMFSRERENESIQFVATVINDRWGIVDCFGFNDISKEEFERIIDRFYADDERVYINHTVLRTLLNNAEILTRKSGGEIPYEYICWKTLFLDVPTEPVPLDLILNMNFKPQELTKDDMKTIFDFEFVQSWFLDTDESEKFKLLVDVLNEKFIQNDFKIDLNNFVAENFENLFDKSEKKILTKRIEMSAYLKYLAGENCDAAILYSLANSENSKNDLALNIIKKGIYEYYVSKKFQKSDNEKATNIFAMKNRPKAQELTTEQVESAISLIESLWVNG